MFVHPIANVSIKIDNPNGSSRNAPSFAEIAAGIMDLKLR